LNSPKVKPAMIGMSIKRSSEFIFYLFYLQR
jgi:hypothetical protein